MERQQKNALKIANWLNERPEVSKVYYPGIAAHAGHEILKTQAKGFGAMVSFKVTDTAFVEKIVNGVKLISFAESLGGVESLITYPAKQTHGDIPKEIRDQIGVTDDLLRFSVGIEDADDLIYDLEQAIEGGNSI
jgi:cystathionine beta-lyase/cystathionine gamma-synthase